jgi:hypothetical protein
MRTNDAAPSSHVCPGIRIHTIVIDQPPGIGMAGIAAIDLHETMVIAALAAQRTAATARIP